MELQDLTLDDESPRPNLATLPPDIIRVLIGMVGDPMENLRLISPTWSAMVVEYLADRRNHPPLEDVHIHAGGPDREWWTEKAKDVKVSATIVAPRQKDHFHGIIRYWPHVKNPDIYESPVIRVRRIRISAFTLVAVLFLFFVLTYGLARFNILISVALVLILAVYYAFLQLVVKPIVAENLDYLEKLFSRCSIVEKLHLHNLNRDTLDVVRRKALKDVGIKHLVVYDNECDADLRKRIIAMALIHGVEQITVCVKKCSEGQLRNIFLAAIEAGKPLDICETISSSEKIFGKEKDFWVKKCREMSDDPFTASVMEGEKQELGEGTHLLRLKIGTSHNMSVQIV
ncbi:hypothetical protein PENTCL1PPCAC_15972 [Pristionchus entomophagus]|uniref:F-box domain-containing protein n=1 Tax=Pristionchus entomophagus TaxID=358040 RepID=A0AAV5THN7_9BILA|nr:hypothetical protein PENTCL1PPCAC_15972 [Pristionchus entomophagus]